MADKETSKSNMADKAETITGLHGLPATIVKLGAIGMVIFLFSWKILVQEPSDRQAAREHANHAVEKLTDAIDRQTQTFIDVQRVTHQNQEKLIKVQGLKTGKTP